MLWWKSEEYKDVDMWMLRSWLKYWTNVESGVTVRELSDEGVDAANEVRKLSEELAYRKSRRIEYSEPTYTDQHVCLMGNERPGTMYECDICITR